MKNNKMHVFKGLLAKVLVAAMIVLTVTVIPSTTTNAATAPTLTKATRNIFIGKQYDLNVNNKVKNSTYAWATDDKKIATVTKNGIVKGISKGKATITCTITTPKKSIDLTCKVTIINPAKVFIIKNKVTTLGLGEKYNLNRKLSPSVSNDKTTWTSSDSSIAAPNASGKFTTLKVGTVTITGTTLSGATDSVTFTVVDNTGVVTTQAELEAALLSNASLITITTNSAVNFTIPSGDYKNKKLVVDAPNSDVTNAGIFASIEIKQIKTNTWYENAIGNLLNILSLDSRIVVGEGASVSIEVNEAGATLRIVNNGVVKELTIDKKADIDITGTSKVDFPVTINVPNVTITSSVPLNLICNEKIELVLLAGSEATKVQVDAKEDMPVVKGNITIKVVVGSGDSAKEETVVGTPVVETPSTGGTVGGGGGGGGAVVVTPAPTNEVIVTEANGTVTYTLPKSYKELSSIKITYSALGVSRTIDSAMLAQLTKYLGADDATIVQWKAIQDVTKDNYFAGQSVRVQAVEGNQAKKLVTFNLSSSLTISYYVTVSNAGVISIENSVTHHTFTMSIDGEQRLMISPKPADITFELKY